MRRLVVWPWLLLRLLLLAAAGAAGDDTITHNNYQHPSNILASRNRKNEQHSGSAASLQHYFANADIGTVIRTETISDSMRQAATTAASAEASGESSLAALGSISDYYSQPTHDQQPPARPSDGWPTPWQLCEAGSSGRQTDNLVWMEGAHRLFPVLNNVSLYSVFLAPGQVNHEQTNISIAMYMESMSSFKAQSMVGSNVIIDTRCKTDFEADMYLAMSWFDRRIRHNCTHAILVTNKEMMLQIWRPDIYFMNSKFAFLQDVTRENSFMLVYPDGMIFQAMRVYATIACAMNLRGFPLDTQNCSIKMQSFAYVREVINLLWHVDAEAGYPIALNDGIVLNDMKVVDKQWSYCNNRYKMFRGYGNWSCLTASIIMQRRIQFHIIQTYVPTAMLVVISWLSFWLDPRSAPARVSLTITTLLTLTTMSNGARQDLPQNGRSVSVSYIKAMDIWLSGCTGFVFCVLLEYTLVSFCVTRKTTSCHHLNFGRRVVHVINRASSIVSNSVKASPALNPHQTPVQLVELNNSQKQPYITVNSSGQQNHVSEQQQLIEPAVCVNPSGCSDMHDDHEGTQPSTHHHDGADVEDSGGRGDCLDSFWDWVTGQSCSRSGCHDASEDSSSTKSVRHNRDVLRHACPVCAQHWERTGKRVDKASRIIFPVTFFLFALTYWLYYLCRECRLGAWCGACMHVSEAGTPGVFIPVTSDQKVFDDF